MAGTRGRSDGPYFTGTRKNPQPVFNKPACKHWEAMQSICLVYPSPPLSSNNNLYLELFFYKWLSSNSAFILQLLTQTPKWAFSIPLWQSQGNRYHSRSWSSLWFSLETKLGAHLSPALWTAYIFSLNLPVLTTWLHLGRDCAVCGLHLFFFFLVCFYDIVGSSDCFSFPFTSPQIGLYSGLLIFRAAGSHSNPPSWEPSVCWVGHTALQKEVHSHQQVKQSLLFQVTRKKNVAGKAWKTNSVHFSFQHYN